MGVNTIKGTTVQPKQIWTDFQCLQGWCNTDRSSPDQGLRYTHRRFMLHPLHCLGTQKTISRTLVRVSNSREITLPLHHHSVVEALPEEIVQSALCPQLT